MLFAATWMDLGIIIRGQTEKENIEKISYDITHMSNLSKKWYTWTYLQNRNRLTDFENKFMVAKGETSGAREG